MVFEDYGVRMGTTCVKRWFAVYGRGRWCEMGPFAGFGSLG